MFWINFIFEKRLNLIQALFLQINFRNSIRNAEKKFQNKITTVLANKVRAEFKGIGLFLRTLKGYIHMWHIVGNYSTTRVKWYQT
jgi:hypothetical protein